ncbi:cytochrome o ubiquinol oxidase subunit III [Acidithiobacillus ferrivorans]|uniref:Cytochrome c oxidase subunit III n=1 Tax=Acidithiobacillus ferrivorans TaxID=160808 RepID=A0A060UNZ9_9PROT|nr:cytochrome c oxidase subunit 3 [Acidithiobacillus ferrivorans]CDQ09976.1 Cytochrome c oxidase subunit III [Acidithiobacillus ferrivorans]SMH65696.1 cytochrome o ubiquinol oxidase subunit III [Acidithiobacillus ferrivorans]
MSSAAEKVDPEKVVLWAGEYEGHDVISTRTFGFWLYILSDGMLFATLFAAYGVLSYAHSYYTGPTPAQFVAPWYTFIQTMVLFLSVLAYGFSMTALKHGNRAGVINGLLAASVLGVVFLGLDIHDVLRMCSMHITPQTSGGLSAFYMLTQVHAAHIFFGLIWMLVMIYQVVRKEFTEEVIGRLISLRMFWQFQAVMWVFIYVFVYLWGYMS